MCFFTPCNLISHSFSYSTIIYLFRYFSHAFLPIGLLILAYSVMSMVAESMLYTLSTAVHQIVFFFDFIMLYCRYFSSLFFIGTKIVIMFDILFGLFVLIFSNIPFEVMLAIPTRDYSKF